MAGGDVWSVVHAERKALAADLAGLSGEQWAAPSLCDGWSVQDVLAHMTATAKMTTPSFFVKFARAGFNLPRLQSADIAVERGSSPADTLARFQAEINSTGRPPGPVDTMLGETIVHGEDIRRAAGISHAYPLDAVVRAAEFYGRSNLIIGAKRRVEGLTLRATDTTWSHGTGPEVAGPAVSLLMAMTGRKQAIGDLSGEGVQTLRSRA
jgi:uncharacterized protein (TIGR03083 family)